MNKEVKVGLGGMPLKVCDQRDRQIREWTMDINNINKPWPGFTEIFRLEGLLIEADIPYKKIVKNGGWLIYYDNNDGGMTGDVIEHGFSYGNQCDLLEIAGFDTEDVVGWLTAQEAFEYFKCCHETRKKTD